MKDIVRSNHHVRFRAFSLDPQTHELFRDGTKIRLYGHPVELLAILVEHPGELITREALQSALWSDQTYVDYEHSINSAIRRLRDALGDDAEDPSFIETVPRLGYRFIAPVEMPTAETSWAGEVPAADESLEIPPGAAPAVPVESGYTGSRRRNWLWLLAATAGSCVAFAAGYFYLHRPLSAPRITSVIQLTSDGRPKWICGTDGSRVYLNELYPPSIGTVSIAGGEIMRIPIDLPTQRASADSPELQAVSPDGSNLLVGAHYDTQTGYDMWIVGASGRPARFIAKAESAAWSPDGTSLLFSNLHGDLYTIPAEGGEPSLLLTSPNPAGTEHPAYFIAWSPDARKIRFVRDGRYWEVPRNGAKPYEILPGWHHSSPQYSMCCGQWTPDGDYFLFVAGSSSPVQDLAAEAQIWVLDERGSRPSSREPMQLTWGPSLWSQQFLSKDGKTIFSVGWILRGQLQIQDPNSRQLKAYLGGISAEFVSFSRDGRSLVYVTYPEGVMWRVNRDGTGLMQLTRPPIYPKNPRWSPDGTLILFEGNSPAGVEEIYTVPSQGGTPSRVLPADTITEDDPTWSPDGKRIVFTQWGGQIGNPNQATPSTSILDLATGKLTTLPPSPEFFFSPRWSPDGRYIVGLSWPVVDLELFDLQSAKWLLIHPGMGRLNFPNWSRDGRFIYFVVGPFSRADINTGEPGVYRVPVKGGRIEQVLDLREFHHAGYWGVWMGLDPDDRPILLQDAGTREVYALTLGRK